jgi:choline transport protein
VKAFVPFGNDDRSTLTDGPSVLSTPTGYPYIQIFYNVTGSLAATNAMTALILILGFFGNVTVMAGSSRQLFAFARDEGMPFSKWIAKVSKLWRSRRTQKFDTWNENPNRD